MIRTIGWIPTVRMVIVGLVLMECAGPGADTTTSTQPHPANADTLFFDDFAGPTLDRTKWNVVVTGRTVNNEQQAYVDSGATLSIVAGPEAAGSTHGALEIRSHYSPGYLTPQGNAFDFISGRINTRGKVEFTYGTAAARMKLPAGAGYWPAFWALGNGRWPDTGEIDIMEYIGDTSWSSVALHGRGYSGNTPLVSRATYPAGTDATDWHIYAVDWSPDGFLFKVDGATIYEVTQAMVAEYGVWAFDNAKYLILNLALGGGYPFGVNGVEQPYYGIPESTVESIKADQGWVLVDWVLITQD